MNINAQQLNDMEARYRASLINSLGGYKSVVLIGSKSAEKTSNLAIFNSFFHIGANPPLCGFIVRPDVSPRHTLQNILETNYYTVNHIHEGIYKNAHQTSARYGENVSEFKEVNLTEEYFEGHDVPFVKESNLKFICEFQQKIDLEINGTIMIIGQIKEIILPEQCLGLDGFIDLELAGTITCSGLDSYHKTEKIGRLTYAKPNSWPGNI
jgi:flavin reductase (DIM6/NTAB) family NADH-FMN oxidoreductase RutF